MPKKGCRETFLVGVDKERVAFDIVVTLWCCTCHRQAMGGFCSEVFL